MMQTGRSITTERTYVSGQESRPQSTVALTVAPRRWAHTTMLIASTACMALGSWPANAAQSKAARGDRNRDEQAISSRATTPEYSSPNADYAVTSRLSRTASEEDSVDVDPNVPWGGGLTRRLWENRMAAPDPNEDVEDRAALNDLIRRIRSVRFEDETPEPAFTAPTEPTPPTHMTSIAGPARKPQVVPAAPMPTPASSNSPTEPPASLTPETLEKLSTALKDENSYVRMTAARALGMIDDPRVIDPLIQALRDESHGVQKNALLSLKERTGQDFGKDPEAWQKWWDQNK